MLRNMVRPMWMVVMGVALAVPAGVEGQPTRSGPVRVQAPPVPTTTSARGNGGRGNAARGNAARSGEGRSGDARGNAARSGQVRSMEPAAARRSDDRRDDRRYDVRRDDVRYDAVRVRDGRYDDRYYDDRWERDAAERRRWQMRSQADLELFGFIGVNVRWDRYDTRDRYRWVERYRSYDRWGRFTWAVEGWFAPRWGDLYFDRDPLAYGPGRLDHRDLRRILGKRTFSRLVRETPGGAGHLWGRVERFGPWGRSMTL